MANFVTRAGKGAPLSASDYDGNLALTARRAQVGRTATRTVAASNAGDLAKAHADFVCNGTNDQVEIRAALDETAALGGGVVQLSEGTFHINKDGVTGNVALLINHPSTALHGTGYNTELRLAGGNSTTTITVRLVGENNAVCNLRINGNRAAQTLSGAENTWENFSIGDIVNSINATVYKVWVHDGISDGFDIKRTRGLMGAFWYAWGNGKHGIHPSGSQDNQNINMQLRSLWTKDNGQGTDIDHGRGIDVFTSDGILIDGAVLIDEQIGISAWTAQTPSRDCVIRNVIIRDAKRCAVQTTNFTGLTLENIIIDGVDGPNLDPSTVLLQNTNNVHINGMTIKRAFNGVNFQIQRQTSAHMSRNVMVRNLRIMTEQKPAADVTVRVEGVENCHFENLVVVPKDAGTTQGQAVRATVHTSNLHFTNPLISGATSAQGALRFTTGDFTTVRGGKISGTGPGIRVDHAGVRIDSVDLRDSTGVAVFAPGNPVVAHCPGYVTQNRGTASIAETNTFIQVTHGLHADVGLTATDIQVTPTSNLVGASKFWVSNVTSTTFRINVDTAPGAGNSNTFTWWARARQT